MKNILTLALLLAVYSVHAQSAVPVPSVSTAAVSTSAAPTSTMAHSADEKAATVDAVMAAEKQRFEAQISKDYAVLDQVLGNDLVYTHSNGNTDSKQSYIQSIRDGKSKYDAIDVEEQKVRIYGNTAIINGMCMIKAMSNGETINTHLKYTDVYVRKGKQWQMVAWQSIRLAN